MGPSRSSQRWETQHVKKQEGCLSVSLSPRRSPSCICPCSSHRRPRPAKSMHAPPNEHHRIATDRILKPCNPYVTGRQCVSKPSRDRRQPTKGQSGKKGAPRSYTAEKLECAGQVTSTSSSAGSQRALRCSLLITYPMLKQGCSYREIEKVEKDTPHQQTRTGTRPWRRTQTKGGHQHVLPEDIRDGGRPRTG